MKCMGVAALLTLCAGANAQVWLVESFENGTNAAAWAFSSGSQTVEAGGGFFSNAYVHAPALAAALPQFQTGNAATNFTGNYRVNLIGQVGLATIVHQSQQPVDARHPAVLLISFNGTPADPNDDWAAYTVTSTTLGSPGTWMMHSFAVPSGQTTLPGSWTILPLGPNAPANPSWNTLMQSVDRLAFTFGDPGVSYQSQTWDIGVDYMLASSGLACYPNCDGSTAAPCLNVLDFLCFLNKFAAQEPYANCDASTTPPALNVLDFACFLMRMAAGCSSC